MKSLICFCYISALIILSFSCNNGPADPVKTAKEENTEKIDSQMDTQRHVDSVAALPTKEDADFVVNAASGGMLEVQLGQLVQTRSKNQRVKQFASMMVKDHGAGAEKLKALARSKNITLPDSISNQQQKEKQQLQLKKGAALDEAYINLMVDDHKNDIREFEKQAMNGTYPDVKAFARDNLRMLHIHLDSALSIQKTFVKKTADPVLPPY